MIPTTTSTSISTMINVSSTKDIVSVHQSSSDKTAATHSKNTASLFLSLSSSSENLNSKLVTRSVFSANIIFISQITATVPPRSEITATAHSRIGTTATTGPRRETTPTVGPRSEITSTVGFRIDTTAIVGSRIETTATVVSSSDIDSGPSSDTIANGGNVPTLTLTGATTLFTSIIISPSSEITVSTGEIITCIIFCSYGDDAGLDNYYSTR